VSDVAQLLSDQIFLTDSGLETDLIFHRGIDLLSFAAFPLLDDPDGRPMLAQYYRDHAAVAAAYDVGFMYETPTWRASADWGAQLGYDAAALRAVNGRAIELMAELRAESSGESVISGCVGPRGDGYRPQSVMTAPESRAYHRTQLGTFRDAGADLASALTITYPDEAIGIVQAAHDVGLPIAVSFTVETDGRLPDGSSLASAIGTTDDATDAGAAYFMINCAHPTHIEHALPAGAGWTGRVRGILANASRRSHAELDEAADLDDGDPAEFASDYQRLRALAPNVTVLGGCCGTDVRHVRAIAAACLPNQRRS
jgi:homocysteine S-methyltransferase